MTRRDARDPALRGALASDAAQILRLAPAAAPVTRLRYLLARRGWKNVWTYKRPELWCLAAEHELSARCA